MRTWRVSCSGSPPDSPVLTADMPLKLQEHLDASTVVGSEVPADQPQPVEWRFDEPQPEWTPYANPGSHPLLPMQAAEVTWFGPSGDWSYVKNWWPRQLPADATLATAQQTVHYGGTCANRIVLPWVPNEELTPVDTSLAYTSGYELAGSTVDFAE